MSVPIKQKTATEGETIVVSQRKPPLSRSRFWGTTGKFTFLEHEGSCAKQPHSWGTDVPLYVHTSAPFGSGPNSTAVSVASTGFPRISMCVRATTLPLPIWDICKGGTSWMWLFSKYGFLVDFSDVS